MKIVDEILQLENSREILSGELEKLRARYFRMTASLTGMPRTGSHEDRMAEYAAKAEPVLMELKAIEDEQRNKYRILAQAVKHIPHQEGKIIRLRYHDRKSWDEVSGYIHMSKREVMYIHASALKHLEELGVE